MFPVSPASSCCCAGVPLGLLANSGGGRAGGRALKGRVSSVLRSVVYQQSSKESATLQPFFTLQLDIQSDKIRTVQDALESLVARESVQGYTTKTKQEVRPSGLHPHPSAHWWWRKSAGSTVSRGGLSPASHAGGCRLPRF